MNEVTPVPGAAVVDQLIAEQAALLRVAELVARESPADDLFRAVAEQLGLLTHVSGALVFRFDDDDMATTVGRWGSLDTGFALGSRISTRGNSATGQVRTTGMPARVEDYGAVEGQIGTIQRNVGMRCGVAAPIRVSGRLWGALVVGSVNASLPAETEDRMARFAELVGVALANMEARTELQILADVQQSLRRVATVVAREEWDLTLPTIVREIGFLHRANASGSVIIRYENDEFATVMAGWGEPNLNQFEGQVLPFGGENPVAYVWHTRRPARQHGFDGATGRFAELSRQLGITESVASPVFVGNRVWGAVIVITMGEAALPAETEERLAQFAELIGTSIGNMNSRLDLIESRARIVQTADETRRRFERDLHDGIQQRLVGISVELRDLEGALPESQSSQREKAANIADQLIGALDDLRELSRGLHPAILSEGGLGPAIRSLARRSPIPVTLTMTDLPRLADSIEVAAYYVVSEALTNSSKYSKASTVEITIEVTPDGLRVTIADDGVGNADPAKGSGLLGLTDRVDALGGVFALSSPTAKGTTITATLPVEPA
jgi:signal transduction histidine kinase